METTEVTLEIASIRLVPALWSRRQLDQPTVRAYGLCLLSAVTLPPVLVARVKGVPMLVDGHHRLAAAQDYGHRTIQARAFEGTLEQATIAAAMANLAHGLPLNRSERQHAMENALRAGWHHQGGGVLALAEIAQAFGVGISDAEGWIRRRAPKLYRMDFATRPTPSAPPAEAPRDPFSLALELLEAARQVAAGIQQADQREKLAEAGRALVDGLRGG